MRDYKSLMLYVRKTGPAMSELLMAFYAEIQVNTSALFGYEEFTAIKVGYKAFVSLRAMLDDKLKINQNAILAAINEGHTELIPFYEEMQRRQKAADERMEKSFWADVEEKKYEPGETPEEFAIAHRGDEKYNDRDFTDAGVVRSCYFQAYRDEYGEWFRKKNAPKEDTYPKDKNATKPEFFIRRENNFGKIYKKRAQILRILKEYLLGASKWLGVIALVAAIVYAGIYWGKRNAAKDALARQAQLEEILEDTLVYQDVNGVYHAECGCSALRQGDENAYSSVFLDRDTIHDWAAFAATHQMCACCFDKEVMEMLIASQKEKAEEQE